MKEIIFVTDIFLDKEQVAGIWTYMQGIINNISIDKTKILIIGKGTKKTTKNFFQQVKTKKITSSKNNLIYTKSLWLKKKELVKNNQTIIHAQRPDFLAPFLGLPNKKIITLHGNPKRIIKEKKNKLTYYLYQFLEKRSIKKADKIIFVDNQTKKEYEKEYSNQKEKFIYIPTGVDLKKFKDEKKKRTIFLYLGRFAPEKQIEKIISLYKNYQGKEELHIIGEGHLKKELIKEAKEDKRIKILESISHNEIKKTLAKTKALLLTSKTEGLPMTVLEALATGTPVITTPVGELPKIIKNGYNGFLIKNIENKKNINKELKEINKIKSKSCEKSIKNYSWKKISEKIMAEY